jgi:hypothetical protein
LNANFLIFKSDNALLLNPERGLYHHIEIQLPISGKLDDKKKEWKSEFATWKKETVPLVLVKFAIGKFVEKKFNSPDTDAMTGRFRHVVAFTRHESHRPLQLRLQCEKPGGGFIFQEDANK